MMSLVEMRGALAAMLGCGLLASLWPTQVQGQLRSPLGRSPQVVYLDIGDIAPGDTPGADDAPLLQLSLALRRYPRVRLFRVSWDFAESSFGSTSTALYDRRRHTMRFYYARGHNIGGDPKDHGHYHALFMGVTEAIIARAAQDHQRADVGKDDAYLPSLSDYGCASRAL